MAKGRSKLKQLWKILGPGIITGAADDDPSGIVTYAIAGAKGGFGFLWAAIVTFPLMAAIQEMCARIGIVTNQGLVGVIKKRYRRIFLWTLALFVVFANVVNIGADLVGMSGATALVLPIPAVALGLLFALGIALLMIFLPYRKIAKALKWLSLALFAYVAAAIVSRPDWGAVLRETFSPNLAWNRETAMIFVAILGTTISPYLFFWQASEEVEERRQKSEYRFRHKIVTKHELKEMREDVGLGMFLSNLVMYFIIVNTGAVFHAHGVTELTTAAEVAASLKPLAGNFAYLLFTVGIIGTGVLAIPVLAGSTAYVVSETFGFAEGLNKHFHEAKVFYLAIVAATLVGFVMNFSGVNPVDALFASAVIYGLISPPLILIILDIANKKEIMGDKVNGPLQNFLGSACFFLVFAAALALIYFELT